MNTCKCILIQKQRNGQKEYTHNLINKGNPCIVEQKKIDAFTSYSTQCLISISFQSQTCAEMFCLWPPRVWNISKNSNQRMNNISGDWLSHFPCHSWNLWKQRWPVLTAAYIWECATFLSLLAQCFPNAEKNDWLILLIQIWKPFKL